MDHFMGQFTLPLFCPALVEGEVLALVVSAILAGLHGQRAAASSDAGALWPCSPGRAPQPRAVDVPQRPTKPDPSRGQSIKML